MASRKVLFALASLLPIARAIPDVADLSGEADFRSIRLHWNYDKAVPSLYQFAITYCEDQPWGKYRCRKHVTEDQDANEIVSSDKRYLSFETVLKGLRMATNYTVEVTPVLKGENSSRGRAFGREIIIRTKGFSARATNCLANSSVVEVETGPNFGGKISVEGTDDPRCSTEGEKGSLKTSYLLKIDHDVCGSEIQNTSVQTFIIVQENLPILTHSTRRFLVMCNYVPETFTVRAGVNLPDDINSVDDELSPVDQSIFEVDPSELFDSANNLFDSRLSEEVGKALKMSADQKDKEPRMWAHLVLMVILVMAAVVGLSCAIWHFVRHARASNRQGFMSPQVEPRAIEETSSMEAVVRDFANGENAPACVENPVALFQTSFVTGPDNLLEEVYDLRDTPVPDALLEELYDLRDLHGATDPIDDMCMPSAGDIHIDNEGRLSEVMVGVNDIEEITVHDLPLDNLTQASNYDLGFDGLCFEMIEGRLLDPNHPVETINPMTHIVIPGRRTPSLAFDIPPPLIEDNFPFTDIYHSPTSSMTVLDSLALRHQSMIHLRETLLEEELLVDPVLPPLSLQHLPESYFEDPVPQHILLDDDDNDDDDDDDDDDIDEGDIDDDVFEDERHDDSEAENEFDRHLNDEDRHKAISRHPSLDSNWKLADGEGQIFPAFSQ